MSSLPSYRLQQTDSFMYIGADMFGPFIVRKGTSDEEKYGTLSMRLSCRAVHTEVTDAMITLFHQRIQTLCLLPRSKKRETM